MQPRGVDVDPGKVDEILGLHAADPSSLIMVLQDVQREYSFLPPEALQTSQDKGHHNSGIIDKRAPSRQVMCQKKSPLRALIPMLGFNNLPELIRIHILKASVSPWIRRSQIGSAACSQISL